MIYKIHSDLCSSYSLFSLPFLKRVGTIVSNLSKVSENRMTLLNELVSVAKSLGAVSTHDLRTLGQQLDVAKSDAMKRVSPALGPLCALRLLGT